MHNIIYKNQNSAHKGNNTLILPNVCDSHLFEMFVTQSSIKLDIIVKGWSLEQNTARIDHLNMCHVITVAHDIVA